MEVGGVVSFASGAVESLLAKLQSMADGMTDTKTKGLWTEITTLKRDLEFIRDNLRNFELMRERTLQAKQWMKQVRETVYDIEDWVDDRLHRADREAGDKHVGIVKGLVQMVRNLGVGTKDQVPSSQIKEFKVLIDDANKRLGRYGLKRESSLPANTTVIVGAADPEDNRVPALRVEETGLVGMEAPVKNVLEQLGEDRGLHLMFTFLVGSGGLGKTTLAKQVWRLPGLQQQFQLLAFVRAGRDPSAKTVLMSILDEVNWQRPQGYESWNEHQVINELKAQLGGKRYLIIIDDVWSSDRWQVIKCALPDDSKGSRVIITTHKEDIAASSCMDSRYVHEMKPLDSFDDQKELFRGRTFGLGKGFTGELAGMSDDMLKKCGGVPLAIIVLAGIMVGNKDKTESQLRSVCTSIIQDLEEVEAGEALSKILHLSYADLPNYLKSCFLYLSVFPEGYVMRKDRVIRRWIAEGFIGTGSKGSPQETGESCFSELINRGLIQPLPVQDNGERGYVVHDSVRELIISLLSEENFVTVSSQLVNATPHDKIRRLSLQYTNQLEVKPTMPSSGILSNVRSLTVFGRDEGKHEPGNFRFLRVLDLEDADPVEKDQLQSIHKLFQLKYLGLGGGVSALPKQIEELENLETLDVRRTRVRQLAVEDGGFQRLAHLLVAGVELPSGVGKLKELQELSMVDVSKSSAAVVQSVRELGELLKLRILGLRWGLKKGDKDRAACEQSLVEALNKLGELSLQHLCLDADKDCSLDFLVESWSPSPNLREFKLASSHYYFPRVPKTMAQAQLPRLTYLEIGIATVSNEDLDILGGLPVLIILKLRSGASGDGDKQRVVIGGQAGFRLLELFWFERRDGAIAGLAFNKGAMPKLRKLRLRCKYNALGLGAGLAGRPELGLGNLSSLKQVHVKMDLEGVANPDVRAAKAAITKAANVPSRCRLEISV